MLWVHEALSRSLDPSQIFIDIMASSTPMSGLDRPIKPRFVLDETNTIDTIVSDDIDDPCISGALPDDSNGHGATYGTASKDASVCREEESPKELPSSIVDSILDSEDSRDCYNPQTQNHKVYEHGYHFPTESSDRPSSNFVSLGNKRRYILPSTPTRKGRDCEDPILDTSSPLLSRRGSITPCGASVIASSHAGRSPIPLRGQKDIINDDDDGDDDVEFASPRVYRSLQTPLVSAISPSQQHDCATSNLPTFMKLNSTCPSRRFVIQDPQYSVDIHSQPKEGGNTEATNIKSLDIAPKVPQLPQIKPPNFGCISPTKPKKPKKPINLVQNGLAANLRSWIINADARKEAMAHALHSNAIDISLRSPSLKSDIFTAKRYAVVLTVILATDNDLGGMPLLPGHSSRHSLALAAPSLNCTKNYGEPIHRTSCPTPAEQKLLLLGLPVEKPHNWPKVASGNKLSPGDVIGLRHGLIWDIELPFSLSMPTHRENTTCHTDVDLRRSEQPHHWTVAVEWDILYINSNTSPI